VTRMKRAIVIGAGAGGATAAKELQGKFQVTLLEAGRDFRPFGASLSMLEKLKSTRLLRDERLIGFLFHSMQVRKAKEGMILINGRGLGGTTPLSAGNAVRADADLRALGIDLDDEFAQIYREIPVTTHHRLRWQPTTQRLWQISQHMGLEPQPLPKLGAYERCANCGRCVFGCPYGVKWDSRQFLRLAQEKGAEVVTRCRVERLIIKGAEVVGVEAYRGRARHIFRSDLVVLAAGGLGTPVVLEQSGLPTESRLFVDPVLCVGAEVENASQCHEMTMPFVAQRDGYIISPYFDYLSFFFNPSWQAQARHTLGIMVKLADSGRGRIGGGLSVPLNETDRRRLAEGAQTCVEMLERLGAKRRSTFYGTLNAGHPGGMLPLTAREAISLHHQHLPGNLYVADASLLPRSLGNPPILTIVALAKRVCRAAAAIG